MMIEDSSKLSRGQDLKIDLDQIRDRLSSKLIQQISLNPIGKLVGFKMVDGNQFGLVVELSTGQRHWFFENELSLFDENP